MIDVRKERMIELYILGTPKTVIARELGINRANVYRWLEEPEVKAEIEKQQAEIISKSNSFILGNVQTHLDVLHSIAVDKKDKRSALTASIYLVDRALGKIPTKEDRTDDSLQKGNTTIEDVKNTFAEMRKINGAGKEKSK
jgi:hypothetical protein